MQNKKETQENKPAAEKKPNAAANEKTANVCAGANEETASLAGQLQKEIDQLRQLAKERDEFLATLQRVQADFTNYQKRIKQEKNCWEEYKDEDILKALLPAFDNLERTLQVKCDSKDAVCLQEGIDLTKKEIFRILDKRKVSRIKTVGEKFNPAFHEAVSTAETGKFEPGVIVEEIRAGYFLQDRVLRPAQVIIAAPKKQTANDSGD